MAESHPSSKTERLSQALNRLYSDNPELQEMGVGTLAAAGPEGLRALFSDSRRIALNDAANAVGTACCVAALALIGFPLFLVGLAVLTIGGWLISMIGACALLAAFGLGRKLGKSTPTREERVLDRVNDVRCVSILLDHLYVANGSLDPAVAGALTRLLPQMKASDAPMLTRQNRRLLNDILWAACFRRDLIREVLQALKQVGDHSALRAVQELTVSGNGVDESLRRLAIETIPYLQSRLAREEHASTLLRAAHSDSADSLLHPITESPLPDTEQLLRPTDQ